MSGGAPDNVRATVDHDLCVGHGGCRRIAPTAFRRTAIGQSEFVDGHAETVKLERLWQLYWHRNYVPPQKRPGL